ncbi:MAG: hypothetical protein QS98_C0003G0045 [archaeon GW2011_AR3]|nr:MAG: hypothetical protein QS98_C0003G0045 [archaeon GW2011_AR3]
MQLNNANSAQQGTVCPLLGGTSDIRWDLEIAKDIGAEAPEAVDLAEAEAMVVEDSEAVQEDQADLAAEAGAADSTEAQGKCIKSLALIAAMKQKCHSSQQKAGQFIARSAFPSTGRKEVSD